MYNNIGVNWELFKYKNSGNINNAFETLVYYLFCYEFKKQYGIFRYFNQAGIETDPIRIGKEIIGFQAKYYEDSVRLSEKKSDLKKCIDTSVNKYPGISKIILYTNKEFTQSRNKNKNKPNYLIEIEDYAKNKSVKIEWRTRSHLEKMLLEKELNYQLNLFFNPEYPGILIDASKVEKEKYLNIEDERIPREIIEIKDNITYNENQIEDILNDKKRIILLSDAGNGKTNECKYMVNKLNDDNNNFAFYKKLNTYSNQKIEEFIPINYKDISIEYIIFILDGFDEICTEHKREFIINLEEFCNKYKNVRIILTSRSNFYRQKNGIQSGTIDNFEEYALKEISKNNIVELLQQKEINAEKFWEEINNKELKYLVYNPFFLIKIIEIYVEKKTLPEKSIIFDMIIKRSFEIDKNKFKNSIDLEIFEENSNNLLGIIALSMELLERNFINDDEYKKIIEQKSNREIIEHSTIWTRQDKKHWNFVHKNFGEYLAAKKIKDYNLSDIKDIITYNRKIKQSWINTLSFLVSLDRDDVLEYLLEEMPEFILYIEKNKFDIEFKRKMFIKIFEQYEKKRIWMEYNIYENFNLISDEKDIEYLLEKIIDNKHFTIVGNALYILREIKCLYECNKKIEEQLVQLCLSKNHINHNKRTAISILANFGLTNKKIIEKIIESNKENENSELRRAYYYYFKKLGIVSEKIDFILERYNHIGRGLTASDGYDDEDELYSFDEQREFCECFKLITTKVAINKVLNFLNDEKIINGEINKEIIQNFCDSIFKVYKDKERIKYILKLYTICENNYQYKAIEIIINKVKSEKLLLDFFKEYLKVDKRKMSCEYEYIVNDECMVFFYNEYKEGNYSDEIAEDILRFCNKKMQYYDKLKNEYELRTSKTIFEYEPRKQIDYKEIENKSKAIFLNKMFDKTEFYNYISGFFDKLDKEEITRSELIKMYNIFDEDEIYSHLYYFMRRQFKDGVKINRYSFNNWDWDWFILLYTYQLLAEKDNKLELNKDQIEKVYNLCKKYISKANFRNAIKYTRYNNAGRSWSTNQLCVCLWFFKYKFNFNYPLNTLLDMLEFEYYINGEKIGISYLTKEIEKQKLNKRIIDNLKNRNIHMDVFENHIEYCIENNIASCILSVGSHLTDKKLPFDERDEAYKYIVHFYGIQEFVKQFFYYLDEDYQNHLLEKIAILDNDILKDWSINKLKKCRKISKKMFYAKYLILMQKKEGIKYYIRWTEKNNMVYIDAKRYDDINDALSKINNKNLIEDLLKLLKITYRDGFKDKRFDGIYSNIRKALINIASKNQENCIKIIHGLRKLIEESNNDQYKNIGFINYIIDELEQKNDMSDGIKYNIKSTIDKIYELELKNKEKSIDWLKI